MRIKLLSYNIRFGGQGRAPLISEVIRACAPNLVILQEAYDRRVVEQIQQAVGMEQWGAQPGQSLAFLSNLPIKEHRWHNPPGSHHPFIHLDIAGTPLRIFGVHLRARLSKWDETRRVREVRALLEDIEPYRKSRHLLVGDFNTVAQGDQVNLQKFPWWIRGLIWLSGRQLQRHAIQVLRDDGYMDGFRTLHPDESGYTLPPPSPHIRLDYLFLPNEFSYALKRCDVVLEPAVTARASDHYPLLAELEF